MRCTLPLAMYLAGMPLPGEPSSHSETTHTFDLNGRPVAVQATTMVQRPSVNGSPEPIERGAASGLEGAGQQRLETLACRPANGGWFAAAREVSERRSTSAVATETVTRNDTAAAGALALLGRGP